MKQIILMMFFAFVVLSCSNKDDKNYSTPYKLSSKTLNENVIQSPVKYKIPDFGKYLFKVRLINDKYYGINNPEETKIVSAGYSSLVESYDGLTWDHIDVGFSEFVISDISSIGNHIFAVGRNKVHDKGGFIISTIDGNTWFEKTRSSHALRGLIGTENLQLAFGVNHSVLVSNDFETWDEINIIDTTSLNVGAVFKDSFILAGDISIVKTTNGKDWAVTNLHDIGVDYGIRFIANNDGVIIISNLDSVYYSSDADNWFKSELDIVVKDINYAYGRFIALSGEDVLYESLDGKTWSILNNAEEIDGGVNCNLYNCVPMDDTMIVVQ